VFDFLVALEATRKKAALRDDEQEGVGEVGERTVHHEGEH